MIRKLCDVVIGASACGGCLAVIMAAALWLAGADVRAEVALELIGSAAVATLSPPFLLWDARADARARRRRWLSSYGVEPPPASVIGKQTADRVRAASLCAYGVILIVPGVAEMLCLPWLQVPWRVRLGVLAVWPALSLLFVTMLTRPHMRLARDIEKLLKDGHAPCMACGYDLTYVDSERCSECGTPRAAKVVTKCV